MQRYSDHPGQYQLGSAYNHTKPPPPPPPPPPRQDPEILWPSWDRTRMHLVPNNPLPNLWVSAPQRWYGCMLCMCMEVINSFTFKFFHSLPTKVFTYMLHNPVSECPPSVSLQSQSPERRHWLQDNQSCPPSVQDHRWTEMCASPTALGRRKHSNTSCVNQEEEYTVQMWSLFPRYPPSLMTQKKLRKESCV